MAKFIGSREHALVTASMAVNYDAEEVTMEILAENNPGRGVPGL